MGAGMLGGRLKWGIHSGPKVWALESSCLNAVGLVFPGYVRTLVLNRIAVLNFMGFLWGLMRCWMQALCTACPYGESLCVWYCY